MSNPLVSVIIPCYNQGKYIDETVESVLAQTYKNLEIVIVNDGSADEFTNEHLKNYSKLKTRVLIFEKNSGLPTARNNAIKEAKGKYILPLDSDDKIHPEYIARAIDILESDSDVGVVYPKVEFFGDRSGVWDLPKFSMPEILLHNAVVAASLFKREDWEKVGGYNKNMKYGFEDFDFWLSLYELGRKFVMIEEVMFYYRRNDTEKRPHSVADITGSREKVLYSFQILVANHPNLYKENVGYIMNMAKTYEIERDTAIHDSKIMEEEFKRKINELERIIEENKLRNLPKRVAKKLRRVF